MNYKYSYSQRLAFVKAWTQAISDLADAIEEVAFSSTPYQARQRQREATEKLRQFNACSTEMFSIV